MGLADVKARKNLSLDDDLFDHAGRSELAAHFFRTTQTDERLQRSNAHDEATAKQIHFDVGRHVRSTIRHNGNVMPEDLQPEIDIKFIREKFLAPITKDVPKKPDELPG